MPSEASRSQKPNIRSRFGFSNPSAATNRLTELTKARLTTEGEQAADIGAAPRHAIDGDQNYLPMSSVATSPSGEMREKLMNVQKRHHTNGGEEDVANEAGGSGSVLTKAPGSAAAKHHTSAASQKQASAAMSFHTSALAAQALARATSSRSRSSGVPLEMASLDRRVSGPDWLTLVRQNQITDVQTLVDGGLVDIDYSEVDGITALMWAAQLNYPPMVKLLVMRGANVNAKALDGATALILATQHRNSDTVGYLITHGAKVDEAVDTGRTGLMECAVLGFPDIATMYLCMNADINRGDHIGNTALIFACQEGHLKMVRVLLDRKKLQVNKTNKLQRTALHETLFALWACDKVSKLRDYKDIIKSLMNKGADPLVKDYSGRSPRDYIIEINRAAEYYRKHDKKINITQVDELAQLYAYKRADTDTNKTCCDGCGC